MPLANNRPSRAPSRGTLSADLGVLKEQAFQAISEHALIILDESGHVVVWAPGAVTLFGYSADEMLGQSLDPLFTPDDLERGELVNELHTATWSGRAEDDRWMVRKDSSRFWASGAVTPILDTEKRVVGFVKLLRDRTDVRSQVDALRNRLESAETIAARRHISLGAVAHELRNPLGAATNAIGILGTPHHTPEMRDRAVAIIRRQLSFMLHLLDNLTDLVQADIGKLSLQVTAVELGPILEQAVETCSGGLQAKMQTVKILASSPIVLEADAVRLQQVLVNLLANASKFSPKETTIWLKATVEGKEVTIRVEDSGIGLTRDFVPHMFELFTQAGNSAQSSPESGMGLGLPLAKQIVELHHGTIEAKSGGPGLGTQMIVHLPLIQPPPAAP